jgi:hypothetical protein
MCLGIHATCSFNRVREEVLLTEWQAAQSWSGGLDSCFFASEVVGSRLEN